MDDMHTAIGFEGYEGQRDTPLTASIFSLQLTTLFKPAGQYFSHISTAIPRRSFGEDLTSSRISHGSMMSSVDGIHLATHVSNVIPSTVNLYQIDLQFTPDVVFRCDSIALLHISNPLTGPGSIMSPGLVQQLQLLPQTPVRPYAVAVALGSTDETPKGERSYKSQVIVWEVTPKLVGFHAAFQELSTRRNDAVSGQPSLVRRTSTGCDCSAGRKSGTNAACRSFWTDICYGR